MFVSYLCLLSPKFSSISPQRVMTSFLIYLIQILTQNNDILWSSGKTHKKMNFIFNGICIAKRTFSFLHRDGLESAISSSFY